MREIVKSRKWQVLAALALIAFGAWAVPNVRDKYEVAKMTEKMKTVCVGRFLIDLPEKAEYSLRGGRIQGFDISAFNESEEAFAARVETEEAEIRAEPDYLGRNKNMEVVKEIQTESGLVGKIFVFGRNVTDGYAGYGEDRKHYHYEGVDAVGYVHKDGLSVNFIAKDYDPDRVTGNLTKLIAQLVPNPDNDIPTEPGFCLDRVFFRDPLVAEQGERVVLFAGLPEHSDLAIVFNMMAGTKPSKDSLLARNQNVRAKDTFDEAARTADLFAGKRAINGIAGEQVLTRYLGLDFTRSYMFLWELNGTRDDVFLPFLSLELQSGLSSRTGGAPVQSSLAESAVLDLWDRISSSIRVRTTVAPKVSARELPRLGSQAIAGDTCIQSGWWECSEGGNGTRVHGGERQYIRQGERMPQALLLPAQTLWEKARGLQPSYEAPSRTPWTLVDRRSRRRITPDVPLAQPGAPIPAAATAAPIGAGAIERASVGAYAMTGNPCPASGWWHCQESDALDGTRWFAQGSVLPAATFTVPERTFGRTSGTPNVMQRRGIWQLVRLSDAGEPAGNAADVRGPINGQAGSDAPGGSVA
ncbi:hypothetical protein MasN3_39770 [Massilia varians]|uniref:Tle cognate immunity protein 4 C-terminal domain-containing protein n=1 Tax=Massilia varians TaxID=457921 RepID=A0ABN6TIQ7_9BURK|nr:T6SS immunity protein Tli4 family protein [Massilia varians]BDT60483.1 hypothetical protein MasN3_39770 [Massilia varians]